MTKQKLSCSVNGGLSKTVPDYMRSVQMTADAEGATDKVCLVLASGYSCSGRTHRSDSNKDKSARTECFQRKSVSRPLKTRSRTDSSPDRWSPKTNRRYCRLIVVTHSYIHYIQRRSTVGSQQDIVAKGCAVIVSVLLSVVITLVARLISSKHGVLVVVARVS